MRLFAAFHHDGQDSQPFIGVASSRKEAFALIRAYDSDQDWGDAVWMDHVFNESRSNYDEECTDKYGAFSLFKRCFFIEEVELDGRKVISGSEESYQQRFFFADGSPVLEKS
jgi:hypothetical protein